MNDKKHNKHKFGLVKWFGGQDRFSGKVNNFGFVQSIDGSDVYINRSELKNGDSLNEKDLVFFEEDKDAMGRVRAKNLFRVNSKFDDHAALEIFNLYIECRHEYAAFIESAAFKILWIEFLINNLNDENAGLS